MKYILYRFLRFILKPLFKIIFRPIVIGLENIPENGAVILAGNHTGNLDAAMMLYGPKRIVHMLAKKELFSNKLSNWFFRSMGAIPVDRKIHDSNAKAEAIKVLTEGNVIGIFPEGTVNRTDEYLLPFKFGAVSFASKTNASVIPFAICGKYKMFKDNIIIIYGKPYKASEDLEKENQKLREKVRKLKLKGDEIYKKRNGEG